ncbi:uridine phosphorylase [Cyclobacterium lianum]|uniref:Uridine phosphorylase n=1 Tax=Cyclobacterium lianum TaxID=388280 RepID=A0A1M7Q2V7_9BACT|nr:nucleoside phosphorylase [Cyclobacterium lianum]SHN24473.1 uridine phosphorylase [Cyclobacterium lianum]
MAKPIPESELIINADGSIYHLNLMPGQVADTVIAVGDPDRVGKISRYFDSIEYTVQKREFVTHTGFYQGKRLSVISTGMGTDNVEIFMTELDALFNVDFDTRLPKNEHHRLNVVRVGTSGSMRSDIPEGSLLVSDFAVGLDSLMAFYTLEQTDIEARISNQVKTCLDLPFAPYCVQGSAALRAKFQGLQSGITVTCPGFFGPQGRRVRLEPSFPDIFDRLGNLNPEGRHLSNFEMETAGYYAMGRLLGHATLSLNAIVANRLTGTFSDSPEELIEKLIAEVLKRI